MTCMNIVGIDPAAKCGWAHSGGTHGLWLLASSKDKHSGRRLERFRRHLFTLKRVKGIDVIGIEDASFGSHNPSVQALHNELRGIAKLCAAEWDIPIYSYTPSHLKKWLTGNGRADKQQMIDAVHVRFGLLIKDDNIADAVTVMERTKEEFRILKGLKNGQEKVG